ncbi:50S ribosomal protein L30 [Marine Group I thaumarchaeote]|uniref:Large ribosomal subunit protein uL30 n=2 Tax=Nitrososphaerota TaxID=651137 RepID=A0A7K4NPT0_9ARCH|nr:putative ribosomal protein L30p/L7e [uncultured marine crenarchaeote HF4000_APKG5E24]NWK02670.1 50S ribosomal protein L30 [Marine Group I thaumarchaeote]
MAKAYLVIRIKGQADVPYWANTTLRLLKLEKKYRAIILPVKENTDGMLKKIQQFVSWQEVDLPTTKELLDKKGRRSGYKKITPEDISKAGFKTINELAVSLSEGKISMTKIKPLKPWFALSPPRKGFKRSTKRLYGQKGILGHNKELTALVKRMM